MATYTLTKKNFLQWYYNSDSDQEQEEMRKDLGQHVIDQLLEFGECTVTVEEIFAECSIENMPIHFLNEFPSDSEDYIEIGFSESPINLNEDEIILVD